MTQEELNKGSRLIGKIMGSTIVIEQDDVKDIPLAFLQPEDMKFHESWKWLMPVVIRVEDEMDVEVSIQGDRCAVIRDGETLHEKANEDKLTAVWTAITQFLDEEG